MADNGHCSTCQTHNTKSGCGGKVESFKKLFGTQVRQNEDYLKLESIMPNAISGNPITKEIWDSIHNILQDIKDYGEIAEDNPTQDKINNVNVNRYDTIFLSDYNKILNALDQNELSGTQLISQGLIDSIKEYIRNYNINDARCNICNTSCQNCQSDCDSNCNCNCQCDCKVHYYCFYCAGGDCGSYPGHS